jgi:Putative MetA-pathway of phenol degradation
MNSLKHVYRWAVLVCFLMLSGLGQAQEPSVSSEPCSGGSVESVPSRPTVSNSTDTTQCGVVEVEYGYGREWPEAGIHQDSLSGGIRLGLLRNFDFHWASDSFVRTVDPIGTRHGYGDNFLGAKYRFFGQGKLLPSVGVFYEAKIPTGSVVNGFSSGRADHFISGLFSKQIGTAAVDFNVAELFAGRAGTTGFDHHTEFALSAAIPATRRLGVVVEGYGDTKLNDDEPAFAASLFALTYKVNPRLVLDGGISAGLTPGAPNKAISFGATYAIANVYSWVRRAR